MGIDGSAEWVPREEAEQKDDGFGLFPSRSISGQSQEGQGQIEAQGRGYFLDDGAQPYEQPFSSPVGEEPVMVDHIGLHR